MGDLKPEIIGLFVLFVFPGFVSMTVYRLIMPARGSEWGSSVLWGLFYTTINFVLIGPLALPIVWGHNPVEDFGRYVFAAVLAVLLAPLVWPVLLVRAFKWRRLTRFIQIPYPTAWDAVFDRRERAFVLAHLNDGSLIGGFFGARSYAGSYPNDGDIYLEAVYEVSAHGQFGEPKPDTRGVLLRKEQYSMLELFDIPTQPQGAPQGGVQSAPPAAGHVADGGEGHDDRQGEQQR